MNCLYQALQVLVTKRNEDQTSALSEQAPLRCPHGGHSNHLSRLLPHRAILLEIEEVPHLADYCQLAKSSSEYFGQRYNDVNELPLQFLATNQSGPGDGTRMMSG